MITRWLNKIIPSRNQRLLNKWQPLVQAINALEPAMRDKTNQEFLDAKQDWSEQHRQGRSLDDLLIEVFAAVREVARRRVAMRHFDVQLLGGIALHHGKIGEMATGEGKTLVATLSATLNALTTGGTHVVTVNDYLAQRDCQWMGEVYRGLGFEVATIFSNMKPGYRRAAYQADIIYGTNSEFGFDFLRDNMCLRNEDKVQGGLNYAIVDEVDSILIDEARTPLIISGVVQDDLTRYGSVDRIARQLEAETMEQLGDFTVEEKGKRAHLTEQGQEKAEMLMQAAGLIEGGLYDQSNSAWLHHLDAALRARYLYHKDVDYVVKDNQVNIVDVFTGRVMAGRRWSQGLHQAVEAKEGVTIHPESQTLASITLQNYFRMYKKLAGMTGTASTEAPEFMQIYAVEVVIIPTNKPNARADYPDRVFLTLEEKYDAITDEIKEKHAVRQPVLVGTVSIENSELISDRLRKLGIPHMTLNAKQHEKESFIVANAGNPGAVTIATNMAGRGTDIVLGGHLGERLKSPTTGEPLDEQQQAAARTQWQTDHDLVVSLGGLHIIGSERHEARRIDNQLRGRCARQGDPGSTRFYLSLQDSLMRIFASDAVSRLMQRLGLGGGESIEHGLLTRAIVNAQRKVETHNFEIRKSLLDYDNVINQQRSFIYQQRNRILDCTDAQALVVDMIDEMVDKLITSHLANKEVVDRRHVQQLTDDVHQRFNLPTDEQPLITEQDTAVDIRRIKERLGQMMGQRWSENLTRLGEQVASELVLQVILQCLDRGWREHLANIDHIKQGIHLRSYAQKQPIQEFKREAFSAFFAMTDRYRDEVCAFLLRPIERVRKEQELRSEATPRQIESRHDDPDSTDDSTQQWLQAIGGSSATPKTDARSLNVRAGQGMDKRKIGRNQPCYCGSGKKYKHCHGRN